MYRLSSNIYVKVRMEIPKKAILKFKKNRLLKWTFLHVSI